MLSSDTLSVLQGEFLTFTFRQMLSAAVMSRWNYSNYQMTTFSFSHPWTQKQYIYVGMLIVECLMVTLKTSLSS